MLIDLAIHPEWREKCRKEAQDLLSRHFGSSPATLREKLGAVPLSAWEEELPTLDACIRETQRTTLTGVLLRRNLREEIKIGGQIVRRGDFLAYPMVDVHQNPEYYPDPHKYDPARWLDTDPVPGAVYPFIGWGAGAHPCAGMKLAKLEMKLIMTLFLTRYEFDLVDGDGKFPDPLPAPDRNDLHKACAEPWIRYMNANPSRLGPSPQHRVLRLQESCGIVGLTPGAFDPLPTAFFFHSSGPPEAHNRPA